MEAHGDLLFGDAMALKYSATARARRRDSVTVGQAVAAVVGMAVEFDVIDRRVGLHVVDHPGVHAPSCPARNRCRETDLGLATWS
jgi:hypothetical protein